MNATEQKALLAILHDGDLLAAIDYVEKACKPSKPKATWPAPIPIKKSKASRFLPPRVALGVAPCGCTLYPDTARQCAACIAARSPDACRALIAEHEAELNALDKARGFITARDADAYRVLHEKYDAELAKLHPDRDYGARLALITKRGEDIAKLDARLPWMPVRTRDFMINPHNGYYGERDKVEVA